MKQAFLSNRFSPRPDGTIHLAPYGQHPHEAGVQLVDPEIVRGLVAAHRAEGAPPLLLDFDHESHDPSKRTEAAGWIEELFERPDGLHGRVRWSKRGEEAVLNGDYRYVSPVWDVQEMRGGQLRPVRLRDAAVTNQPNLKGLAPLSNRSAAGGPQPQPNPQAPRPMKDILTALNLPETADATACVAEIGKLKNRLAPEALASGYVAKPEHEKIVAENTALKNRNTTLLGELVERDLEAHAAVIADPGAIKTQLLANREGTLAILKGLKPAKEEKPPLTNRAAAKTPGAAAGSQAQKQESAIQAIKLKNRCSYKQALATAKVEHPDLFKPEAAS